MPVLKLSQYLKIGGIAFGALGALRIIFAESDGLLAVLMVHWICLVVLAIGAAVYFAGVWEAKHEAAIAGAKATTSTAPTA